MHSNSLAFLADFSGIMQLKNIAEGLVGTQKMHISLFQKWEWPILTQKKLKSSPDTLLIEFLKNNTLDML